MLICLIISFLFLALRLSGSMVVDNQKETGSHPNPDLQLLC